MRRVICCISVLVLGSSLIGCGQSGALQLPSNPNYDKRAKYLLYPNVESGQKLNKSKRLNQPTNSRLPNRKPLHLNLSLKGHLHEFYPH